MSPELPIFPSTRIAALLDRYPQLEEILIALAPPFRKLKNPLLRKGVARLASLQQAAVVGGLPVSALVNELRSAVGQETLAFDGCAGACYFTDQPEWFPASKVVQSIDESKTDPDQMPIAAILQVAGSIRASEMIELITAFIPAPGIDVLKRKGLRVWSVRDERGLIRTYVSKPGSVIPKAR